MSPFVDESMHTLLQCCIHKFSQRGGGGGGGVHLEYLKKMGRGAEAQYSQENAPPPPPQYKPELAEAQYARGNAQIQR